MTNFHVIAGPKGVPEYPVIRRIGFDDIRVALQQGVDDFLSKPSHLVFIGLIYPVVGLILAFWASNADLLPILYPLMSGFALIGPLAAIGLYEISRRREQNLRLAGPEADVAAAELPLLEPEHPRVEGARGFEIGGLVVGHDASDSHAD